LKKKLNAKERNSKKKVKNKKKEGIRKFEKN